MSVQETRDRRQSYLDFLQYSLLPLNRSNAMKIQRKSSRFVVQNGLLFRLGFNQAPLRYITSDDVDKVLQEVHAIECGEHQEGLRLLK